MRLAEARAYAPELPTGWLVGEITDAIVTEARAMGLTQLCPNASTVTAELVHRLHADGLNFPDKLISHLSIPGRP